MRIGVIDSDAIFQHPFFYGKKIEIKRMNPGYCIKNKNFPFSHVYEVLYKITGKQKYLEYAEKHCKILEYALKADENNDLIYGNAGAVIVLLNLYHLL